MSAVKYISNNFLVLLAVLSGVITLLLLAQSPPAHATYNGARLIDNFVFRKSNSMSANQIQSFLESKNSGLKSLKYKLSCYGSDSKERELYTAAGAQCDKDMPASHIIYYAAKIYGINPRVILATLQKEQSLITTTNPTSWQLSQAMGYGCPTTGSCSDSSNFSYQIDAGTWGLRWHYERANGNNAWWGISDSWVCGSEKNFYKPSLYPGKNTRFYDGNNVHYRTHNLANAATSAMYCYTPHAYNNPDGLFGLPKYGTKGEYYTGSYNFIASYEKWFGSTQYNNCVYPTDNSGGVYRLMQPNTNTYFLTSSPSEVCTTTATMGYQYDGIVFYPSETDTATVYRLVKNGSYLYTASTTERDEAINLGFRLEGEAFKASKTYNPTNAPMPVYRLNYSLTGGYFYTVSSVEANHAVNKLGFKNEGIVFYTNNTTGKSFPHSIYRLAHPGPGYLFTASSSERDYAINQYSFRNEGTGFQTRIGYTNDNLPVYRLASGNGYLYTTSLSERKLAMRLGYRSEGIAYFAYPTSNLGATGQIYRLSHPDGTYLFTQSDTERNSAVSNYGYRYEGVGFRVP